MCIRDRDSVNALYDTFYEIFTGDFGFLSNQERLRTLKILLVFTLGSATGLVTLSHLLNYVLKKFKHMTSALILGFITGSLGVVWPWKKTIFKLNEEGIAMLDSNGKKIIMNYERYLPDMSSTETWTAFFFVIVGISILFLLDWYGKHRKRAD